MKTFVSNRAPRSQTVGHRGQPAAEREPGLAVIVSAGRRPGSWARHAFLQRINQSPKATAQRAVSVGIRNSADARDRREQVRSLFGATAQRESGPQEYGELLQGRFETVQRTLAHVNQVATRYNAVVGHMPPLGVYGGIGGVAADLRAGIISQGQHDKMIRAWKLEADGRALPVDRRGTAIPALNPNDPAMQDAANRMGVLANGHAVHFAFMTAAVTQVTNRFGAAAEMEFWKGGHMVFADGGVVYHALAAVAAPIAALKADGSIKNKTEFAGMTGTNLGGWLSDPTEQRRGSMMVRRPGPYKETSHYGNLAQYPNPAAPPPQYGVDMPEPVGGHVLFGITPTGDTFIQTEGAGFQNFVQALPTHLWGFVKLKAMGTQTGMTGTSTRSEQGANPSDLREADNQAQDSITAILNSIV